MFALADVNSFYASCEKVFRPDLRGKPVVVLSNNDGCVIARSKEAKLPGIKMGVPWFQLKDAQFSEKLHVFSSNYELYASISGCIDFEDFGRLTRPAGRICLLPGFNVRSPERSIQAWLTFPILPPPYHDKYYLVILLSCYLNSNINQMVNNLTRWYLNKFIAI